MNNTGGRPININETDVMLPTEKLKLNSGTTRHTGEFTYNLLQDNGELAKYNGERLLLVEKYNTRTNRSTWRVECPAENIRLPEEFSKTRAIKMWEILCSIMSTPEHVLLES